LGLSIVRQIAELHGGSARVVSAGAGRGASFIVALPISAVRELPGILQRSGVALAPPDGTELDQLARRIDGLRVLVVDDEPDARAMIERLLREHGATVTASAAAEDAMQILQAGRFDILLSDIGMPGEDGYSLIKRVRALPAAEGGDIHAIALTAFARAEDRRRVIAAGFTAHLAKPVEAVDLIKSIAAAPRG
jgi:CheY-like chemotaxis protein